MAKRSHILVVVLLTLLSCLVSCVDCFDFVNTKKGPATSIWRDRPGIMLLCDRCLKGLIKSLPLIILIRLHLKQESCRLLNRLPALGQKWKYLDALAIAVAGEEPQV